jgi:hypothetical protein
MSCGGFPSICTGCRACSTSRRPTPVFCRRNPYHRPDPSNYQLIMNNIFTGVVTWDLYLWPGPDLQVCEAHEHPGQVRSQVRGSRKPQVRSRSQVRGFPRPGPETWTLQVYFETCYFLSHGVCHGERTGDGFKLFTRWRTIHYWWWWHAGLTDGFPRALDAREKRGWHQVCESIGRCSSDEETPHVYVYIWIHIYVYIYMYTYIYICMFVYIYVYIYTYIYTYIYMHTHTHTHTHTHKHTHTHTLVNHSMYIFTIVRTRTCYCTTITCGNFKKVKGWERKNRPWPRPGGLRSRSQVRGVSGPLLRYLFFLPTLKGEAIQGWRRPHNFEKFEGPVLNCRVGTHTRCEHLNELVIREIRNNASAIFQKFLFSNRRI